jgi:hypothetical protein
MKQNWFLERINKIDKLLAELTKRKKEETHVNIGRENNGNITKDTMEIQRIIR